MIAFHEIAGTNVLELVVEGQVTRADSEVAQITIEDVVDRRGKVRLFKDASGLAGFDSNAVPPTFLSEFFNRLNGLTHVAVLIDEARARGMRGFLAEGLPFEVRFFGPAEADKARAWLRTAP